VARELLSSLFPNAATPFDRRIPGVWDSIETSDDNQAVILMADYFDADRDELDELTEFVEEGNYIFIIARNASDDVASFFNLSYNSGYSYYTSSSGSLRIKLESPLFAADSFFTYPGKKYEGSFNSIDTTHTTILGRNNEGRPNFVQLNKGEGSFFIHAAPLAFSNYFILHKANATYYQQAFSVLPQNLTTILWNEYFLERPRDPSDKEEPNWLSALFSYPSFAWGLLVGAFTLALFVLLGMRRRQRLIPPFEKPNNDSLDFVKTLGRLYYDRKDHKNLAIKMAAYFLEHVRSKYKLPTHTLDGSFMQTLHFKSGYPQQEIQQIITSIQNIKTAPAITEWQLSEFHKQLELFYQNT